MKTVAIVLSMIAAVLTTAAPATSVSAASVRECRNADLVATYRSGGPAMNTLYGWIELRNVSQRSCTVRGYGGLSYVGHGDGSQVGSPAQRDPSTRVLTRLLEPGGRVRSRVAETSVAPYDAARCDPAAVDGFRVYVPDSRTSQYVARLSTTCARTDLQMLRHQAFT